PGRRPHGRPLLFRGAVLLVLGLLTIGAAGCGMGQSQNNQSIDREQARVVLVDAIRSEDIRAELRDVVRQEQETVTAESILRSPTGEQILAEELEALLHSPDLQQALHEELAKLVQSPDMRRQIQQMVVETLQQMLTAGAQNMGGQQGGGGGAGGGGTGGGNSGGGVGGMGGS